MLRRWSLAAIAAVIVCGATVGRLADRATADPVKGYGLFILRYALHNRDEILSDVNRLPENVSTLRVNVGQYSDPHVAFRFEIGDVLVGQAEFNGYGKKVALFLSPDCLGRADIATLPQFTFPPGVVANYVETNRPLDVDGWRLAGIFYDASCGVDVPLAVSEMRRMYNEVAANLGLSDALGFVHRVLCGFRSGFGMIGSLLGKESSSDSGSQGEGSNQTAKRAEQPTSVGTALRGIGSLPLSAKVGGTLVFAFLAWLIQVRGFGYLTLGRGNIGKGSLYLASGGLLWLLPIFVWWASA